MIQNSIGGENVTDYVVGEQCYPSYRPASPRLKEQTRNKQKDGFAGRGG